MFNIFVALVLIMVFQGSYSYINITEASQLFSDEHFNSLLKKNLQLMLVQTKQVLLSNCKNQQGFYYKTGTGNFVTEICVPLLLLNTNWLFVF